MPRFIFKCKKMISDQLSKYTMLLLISCLAF